MKNPWVVATAIEVLHWLKDMFYTTSLLEVLVLFYRASCRDRGMEVLSIYFSELILVDISEINFIIE